MLILLTVSLDGGNNRYLKEKLAISRVQPLRVIWLQTPTAFWLGGGSISLSYGMYVGLMILNRQNTYSRITGA